jgi:NAD-dependent DNA ligase
MNLFQRQAISFRNDQHRAVATLVGIAQGLLADQQLVDSEIRFLQSWLEQNEAISAIWPGSSLFATVNAILADGIVSNEERVHLIDTLQKLIGGTFDDLASATHATELALDHVEVIDISDKSFCLTGDFVFGPKAVCHTAIETRGGTVTSSVGKRLNYLVVGGLGSPEWKHGSFGTKIEKAMELKQSGVPLLIVHEDVWAASINLVERTR